MKRIEKMVVCRPSFSGWQLTARLFSTLTATPSNSQLTICSTIKYLLFSI